MNFPARASTAPVRLTEISEVARALGVTARTLRHYQDQGLIRSHRLARNVRGYDVGMIEKLGAIVALRAVGLTIADIRAILALGEEPGAQLRALRAALAEALAEQQAQIERLAELARRLASDDALPASIAGLRAQCVEPATTP